MNTSLSSCKKPKNFASIHSSSAIFSRLVPVCFLPVIEIKICLNGKKLFRLTKSIFRTGYIF